jgi:hypothetical protein
MKHRHAPAWWAQPNGVGAVEKRPEPTKSHDVKYDVNLCSINSLKTRYSDHVTVNI